TGIGHCAGQRPQSRAMMHTHSSDVEKDVNSSDLDLSLEELLNRLHQLSQHASSRKDFYHQMVVGLREVLGAREFTFWEPRGDTLGIAAESHSGAAAGFDAAQVSRLADLAVVAKPTFSRLGPAQPLLVACPVKLADEKRG